MSLRHAVALDPNSVQGYWMLGHAISQQGRHDQALAASRRARELDPLSALSHSMSSQIAFSARDLEAAVRHARGALLAEPDVWVAYWQLGQAYQQLGRTDQALEALAEASRLSNGNSKPISLSAYTPATSGRVSEARDVLTALEQRSQGRYVPPYAIALVYAGLKDAGRMFEWLDNALTVRDVHSREHTRTMKTAANRYHDQSKLPLVLVADRKDCNFFGQVHREGRRPQLNLNLEGDKTMRFLCLYRPTKEEGVPPSREEMAEMGKLIEEMVKAGVLLATEGCQPSSKGARVRLSGGRLTVTDGPFIETKELIGGFAIIQAKSKEEAIELTKRFLKVAGDGESEIRQLHEASDFPQEIILPEEAARAQAWREEPQKKVGAP